MADGFGFTVRASVLKHPVATEYVTIGFPADAPVTMPVAEPTVARVILLLDHVPPAGEALSVVVLPTQTAATPLIAEGIGLTVTPAEFEQPVGSV
jgi:hypothetical protein